MKIGLISDTHGWLDGEVFEHFESCDEIWHAGDIGTEAVLDQLEAFKPIVAVFGNIDGQELRRRTPGFVRHVREGVQIFMTHIGGAPGRLALPIRKQIEDDTPDLFICGHSHILKIVRDPLYHGMIHMNPGAAGKQGFHVVRTVVRFNVEAGKITKMEVIHLGDPDYERVYKPM